MSIPHMPLGIIKKALKYLDSFNSTDQNLNTSYWQTFLSNILHCPEGLVLDQFLTQEYQNNIIYPHAENIFAAFKNLPADFSVVILGQDPYHGHEMIDQAYIPQAHGLAFSVNKGLKIPASLKNIEKELAASEKTTPTNHGDLTDWVKQGVLLLNTSLTVRAKQPASHYMIWQNIMQILFEELVNIRPLIFVLWGSHAQKFEKTITASKLDHHILKAPHPSPLSAYRGFLGCNHFTQINNI
jgi:uracil-DNA glycosylase